MKAKMTHGRKPRKVKEERVMYKGEPVTITGRNGQSVRIKTRRGEIIVRDDKIWSE